MDLRAFLFEPLRGRTFSARLTSTEPGLLAGVDLLLERASHLSLAVVARMEDGAALQPGACVLRVNGSPAQIARGEEELLACVGKPSGVATAAARYVALARDRARIVCGAWKKVAPELRPALRKAIATGGAGIRLVSEPFIYLDKNHVRMFSGVSEAVARAHAMNGRVVAVQLRGETAPIAAEALTACSAGAGVLMVDTGSVKDLRAVVDIVRASGYAACVKIAFGGGVTHERLDEVILAGAQIVDIGRAIIDARLLDFSFDIEARPP
ncbi:MAG: nicotinate-nucleotide pyrophosphorylase [bacterium]